MSEMNLRDVVGAITIMVESEEAVATFYQGCADLFDHDRAFWTQLAEEELKHARVLQKLAQIIERKPQEFRVGKVSPLSALRAFVSRVGSDSEKLRSGRLSEKDALLCAYLIEKTFVEQCYLEVIETQNPDYMNTLQKLANAETKHKEALSARIKQSKESTAKQSE